MAPVAVSRLAIHLLVLRKWSFTFLAVLRLMRIYHLIDSDQENKTTIVFLEMIFENILLTVRITK